jgi:hypothetical protein
MTDDWDEDNWNDDSDDATETIVCPNCGIDVYEDAEQCPGCHEYIMSGSLSAWESKPVWWVVLGFIGIIATIFALSGL